MPLAFSLHGVGVSSPKWPVQSLPTPVDKGRPWSVHAAGEAVSSLRAGVRASASPALSSVALDESLNFSEQHLSASPQSGRIIQAHGPRCAETQKRGSKRHLAANETEADP